MNQYFATVVKGLEPLLVEELKKLGAKAVEPGFCGAAFRGDRALLYKVNLWAMLPFRILRRLDEFDCATGDELFTGVQRTDWSEYLTPDKTLAVTATGKTKELNHTIWDNRYLGYNRSICLVSVYGTDFPILGPQPFNKGWYSHKFKGAGVRYEQLSVCRPVI